MSSPDSPLQKSASAHLTSRSRSSSRKSSKIKKKSNKRRSRSSSRSSRSRSLSRSHKHKSKRKHRRSSSRSSSSRSPSPKKKARKNHKATIERATQVQAPVHPLPQTAADRAAAALQRLAQTRQAQAPLPGAPLERQSNFAKEAERIAREAKEHYIGGAYKVDKERLDDVHRFNIGLKVQPHRGAW